MASVQKRGDRWYARFRDHDGKERAHRFGRKVDAQAWLNEQTAALVTGTYADPLSGRITFGAFYARWSDLQSTWQTGTRQAMDLAVRDSGLAEVPMIKLRRSHIETWVKGMTSRGLAPGTMRTRVNNVRAVIRAAIRDRIISTDPAEGVKLPARRKADKAMTIPTTDQVRTLMSVVDPAFAAGVALGAFAGLRIGEVCGVQVGDIAFLGRALEVTRQVQRANGAEVEIRPPKYGSERTVYLPDDLVTLLSQHVAELGGGGPDRWLFPGADGVRPLHQNSAGYHWRRARDAAGVPGLRFHDLRHFYASGLIAEGADVVAVQRALGHRSATVTLNVYSHLWPTAEDRTRNAAAKLMASALNPPAGISRATERTMTP